MSASKSRVYSASPTARARKRMLASVFLVGAGERAGALLGKRTVDGQLRVADDLLDLAVGLEVLEGFPGERTVDLETIDEGGNGDQAVRLDILVELVGDVLVEDDGVLGLVLDCGACQLCILKSIFVCSRSAASGMGRWVVFGLRCSFVRARCVCAGGGGHVPLPFDHFFFCFLPPVAEGAIFSDV